MTLEELPGKKYLRGHLLRVPKDAKSVKQANAEVPEDTPEERKRAREETIAAAKAFEPATTRARSAVAKK